MDDKQASDASLMQQIACGSKNAFAELYRRHRDDVYRYAFAQSRSRDLAEDVTQNVFLNTLKNPSSFEPDRGSVRAWLYGCARYMMLGEFNKAKRWSQEFDEDDGLVSTSDPHEELLLERRVSTLHAAIVGLPLHFREVVVLCELQELSYAEAAVVIACPVGTVRSRLHRARALLADRLSGTRESTSSGPQNDEATGE